ncbi:MBL fold metallo-hydrolase [Microvirga sp. VF16]|uniref:MBL fold metallo-hydrolase n=1 Tax=Microvirga sp. VF16 TaxID=2807101 RepID=UPI00193DB078|nr:MBL fold metallo-hydrolase [Microvirga sp. VF16]QRM30205.1 MBL fold metallo-hydrolase [Microvirga sp. VF16]
MSTASFPQPAPERSTARPQVDAFFDRRTCSVQYIVADPATGRCALIDPVLDYDEKSGSVATTSADAMLARVKERGLTVEWILDTHPHADHFSASGYLKDKTGAKTAIGERIVDVQRLWKEIYNLPDVQADGSQWDCLFADGDDFQIGDMDVRVLFSPGHTLASITYVVGDAAFIHDTLFMPDFGTARCDFPGGDAKALWRTIQRILSLPSDTRLFSGHDYMPGGRPPAWESTVASQKAGNIHLVQARSEDEFVAMRQARDAKLPMPKLILHALQVNMAGGRLPVPESNGTRYLKIPLDALPYAVWD